MSEEVVALIKAGEIDRAVAILVMLHGYTPKEAREAVYQAI